MSRAYLEDVSAIWEQVRDKFHTTMSRETVQLWFGDMYVVDFDVWQACFYEGMLNICSFKLFFVLIGYMPVNAPTTALVGSTKNFCTSIG